MARPRKPPEANQERRQAPSTKALRSLYLLSGNLCANPACATVLINANGTLVADVCHIKAEKPGGARYDKSLSPEQRRAPENLILLCSTCHTLVDREPEKYTVALLTKWKKERESHFSAIGDTLRQRYVAEVTDEGESVGFSLPATLKSYVRFLEKRRYSHTIDEGTPGYVADFVEKFRHISLPDRELIRAIVEKAIALGGGRETDYGVQVHPDDLKTIQVDRKRLSDYRIRKLSKTLDRNGLGGIDADEEPALSIAAPDYSLGWSTLKDFLERRGNSLRDLICDLKFGLLD
jgi:hypothetical protein